MNLTVKQIKSEGQDIISLILQKPPGFTFYPGQYLDISLPKGVHDPLGQVRAFTISSSPTEDFLMITTRKRGSQFKKYLSSLKLGNKLTTSHPVGTFTLDETEKAVFLAGGIGITPFRSIIKYALDQKLKTPITLIYSNSNEHFLFKEELNNWQKIYSKLEIIYIATSQDGHLTRLPTSYFPLPTSIYYLAGPPKFVDDMEKLLLKQGVDPINIRYDRFDGY